MGKFEIHHELFVASSAARTYQAITQPQHLVNWWPLKCVGKPIEGETYNFNFTDAYDWHGIVSKVVKNKIFQIKMTKSDDNWNQTSFGFNLEEKNDGVVLRFQHLGWEELNEEFRQSSYCWAILLQGLKNYLEKNVVIPFEERE